MGTHKKKRSKIQKTTFKQKIVSVVVILVPSIIVIAWVILTIVHNPATK